MSRYDTLLAALVCSAKLALPPAGLHLLLHAPSGHGDTPAYRSHGRGPAGEFLPDAERPFIMGAAAEVALKVVELPLG